MTGDTNLQSEMELEDIMLAEDGDEAGTDAQTEVTEAGAAQENGGMLDNPQQPTQENAAPEGTTAKENKDQAGAAEAGDTNPQQAETVELEFLGEKKAVSLDEARALAQKGMNYDHVVQQRDEYKDNHPALRTFNEIARRNGITVEQYAQRIQDMVDAQEDQAELQRLITAGNTQEVATELLKLRRDTRRKEAEAAAQKAQEVQAEQQRRQAEQRRNDDYAAFVKAYPDVKTLPPEVVAAVTAGESPLTAYMRYENQQLRQKLTEKDVAAAAQQKNTDNKNKNPGSLSTSTTPEAPDPLDAAFRDVGL